jgi:hypothetical protein
MKLFHICTIANKLEQYEEMKQSFIKAGFDESRCQYSLFDNSKGNIYEPYNTFNTIRENTVEPYIIFCHQDVLMNQGHGFERLIKVLEELEQLDPKWAIAGNAGINKNYKLIAKITDPNSTPIWRYPFPQKVHSLDENFLVIKSSANIKCSLDLKGFHFYGTDLCLNAILNRQSCYVINFHLIHLSGGNFSQDYWDALKMFQDKWSNFFSFCYIKTPASPMILLSKYKLLRKIFNNTETEKWYLQKPKLQALFDIYNTWATWL